ncbi:hypothetical protein BMS3Bbin02_00041 [bacterium BMS3Bbin02]|nr:hypothetical protein BMS3Bbin02_00041 [bacterium BMS3Bbin02]
MVGQVLVDGLGEPGGEGDGAAGGRGFGLAETGVATDFGERPFDAEDALVGLVTVGVEGDEFPDPAPGVRSGDDQCPVSGVDGAGEVRDLFGREKPLLGVLDLGQGDVPARCGGDEASVDSVVEDPAQQRVGLADRGRGVPVGVEV